MIVKCENVKNVQIIFSFTDHSNNMPGKKANTVELPFYSTESPTKYNTTKYNAKEKKEII